MATRSSRLTNSRTLTRRNSNSKKKDYDSKFCLVSENNFKDFDKVSSCSGLIDDCIEDYCKKFDVSKCGNSFYKNNNKYYYCRKSYKSRLGFGSKKCGRKTHSRKRVGLCSNSDKIDQHLRNVKEKKETENEKITEKIFESTRDPTDILAFRLKQVTGKDITSKQELRASIKKENEEENSKIKTMLKKIDEDIANRNLSPTLLDMIKVEEAKLKPKTSDLERRKEHFEKRKTESKEKSKLLTQQIEQLEKLTEAAKKFNKNK